MSRTQVQKPKGETAKAEPAAKVDGTKLVEKGEELKSDLDALIDEIDDVLEKNAEQFVKNYVQQGGE